VRKALIIFLRTFIIVGAFVLTFLIAVRFHPPLAVWAMAVSQHAYPMCRSTDFYQGARQRVRQNDFQERIAKERRLVRSDGPLELWETPHGPYWIPAGNVRVLDVIVAQQMSGLYAIDGQTARPGDIVIDCGAHVGVYTREALQRGARKVISIEPAPANLECFRRTFHDELASGRVVLVPKGVWDREDVLPLYEDDKNTAADGFVEKGSTRRKISEVPLLPLDRIVQDLQLERVDLIKMDIKGATAKALTGAAGTLRKWRPRIALSTEEDEDDPAGLRALVATIEPAYRVRCGPCSLAAGLLHPDVLLFH
jgi:FkbM family methyltransferase